MAEANELQALDKISTEVDAAQIKVILATQCIKAQAFLVEKLKKQVQRNLETCGYISSANLKLQSEITQAEQEIKSFYTAMETIRMANVELKKDWLIAKEKKLAIIERVQLEEKKYEELWLECKSRYESLPYVQKLLKVAQTAHSLKDQITSLDKEAEIMNQEIQTKKVTCVEIDRKRVIQLAEFLIHERPKLIGEVNEKTKAITEMMNKMRSLNVYSNVDIKVAEKEEARLLEPNAVPDIADENPINDEIALIMPKLQSDFLDIDDLISVKLDQVKMKKGDYTIELERKESFSKPYFDLGTSVFNRKSAIDESISLYFTKPKHLNEENRNKYSRKKLINILDDVKIDANNAMDMISKVVPGTLQSVDFISAETKPNEDLDTSTSKVKETIQIAEIEDIDMKSSNVEDNNIVKPPTQFLDSSLNTQKSQEMNKTVSFDLTVTSQNNAVSKTDFQVENDTNVTSPENPLEVSAVSDDGFAKIKDMVLKKHNLDSTPPFVYAKNTLQMKMDEQSIVTSKFFKTNENAMDETEQQDNINETQTPKFNNKASAPTKENSSKIIELEAEDDVMIISKNNKAKITDELCNSDKPFGGYLFSHGPQGLPDSLDVSISTTGYEDGDDFAHCIDSSLLLSPKADLPMSTDNPDGQSQEAPNFLSGLRKTGLSFFGRLPVGDTKPDSSASNQGNSGFNFNFGGEEKKNRGGLFSMFQ